MKGKHKCTNMVVNILSADPNTPTPTLEMWSIGQNSTFLKHGHVSYQIKWKHEI